jgi:hypothetical protein
MDYKKFDLKKYKSKNGEVYKKPIINKAEAKEILEELESRALFSELSNEFKYAAAPKDHFK